MPGRAKVLTGELPTHPDRRGWTASLGLEKRGALRAEGDVPAASLRARLADALRAAGARLSSDPELARAAEEIVVRLARLVAERFHSEISAIVSATVARWDADETSDKLELLLGHDLQFIRINGTIVGGLAGLAIHAGSRVLG